jgi:hypothetical protein
MAELALSELKGEIDPFLPLALLQTGQSVKSRFLEREGYKAAFGDLILSAITRLSGSLSNFNSSGIR